MPSEAARGNVYAHAWREGDLVLLDNLAVAHLASAESQRDVGEAGGVRILHRTVVAGTERLRPCE